MSNCPCGNNYSYQDCCGAIHFEHNEAKTAEQLMRSRYTAFVKANGNYLMKSQSLQTRDEKSKLETVKWTKSVKWLKLEIIETIGGTENDSTGIVEFKAYYKFKLLKKVIHERSNFIKEDGKWVYLNGEHL